MTGIIRVNINTNRMSKIMNTLKNTAGTHERSSERTIRSGNEFDELPALQRPDKEGRGGIHVSAPLQIRPGDDECFRCQKKILISIGFVAVNTKQASGEIEIREDQRNDLSRTESEIIQQPQNQNITMPLRNRGIWYLKKLSKLLLREKGGCCFFVAHPRNGTLGIYSSPFNTAKAFHFSNKEELFGC